MIDATIEPMIRALAQAGAPSVTAEPYLADKVLAARRRSGRRRRVGMAAFAGVLLVGGTVAARTTGHSRYVAVYVPSGSMGATVAIGETLIADRTLTATYGDVVAVHYTADGTDAQSVRRIIGLPGDKVACPAGVDGRCHAWTRNGVPLNEPYVRGTDSAVYPEEVVGPGEAFFLGDQRDNAVDSRMWGTNGLPDVRLADIFAVGVEVRAADGQVRSIPGTPAHERPGGRNVDPAEQPTTSVVNAK
jgi:signal peptidase I